MFPYWFLLFIPAWLALSRLQPSISLAERWSAAWLAMFALLVLMIGLRHQVGGDWGNYLPKVLTASYMTLTEAVTTGDPAYGLLNWLAAKTGLGIYLVNTLAAGVFSWGLLVFCRAQPRPWLALVVAIPYLVTVVAMGYTRQAAAIGFAMLALVALSNLKILRFVVFIVLAATFHKTAVILLPLAVLAGTKRKLWTAFWVGLTFVLFFILLLQESVEALQSGYIDAQYQSQGAAVRLAMNAVPAVLFLRFRRRFVMPQTERTFWIWMSLGALAFLVLLKAVPSSTAVDRIALYWIPIQLYVLSRLPNALGKPNGRNAVLVYGVVAYSAVVLFVWLVFASHAHSWLPYQFYPWVALLR